jgi:hypothetical protein
MVLWAELSEMIRKKLQKYKKKEKKGNLIGRGNLEENW